MLTTSIQAVVFYKHDPDEVAGLTAALIPMADHLACVSTALERKSIRHILEGRYFRYHEAQRMRTLLLRATRHARANLSDYFPLMREGIMGSAERLEVAADLHWDAFKAQLEHARPTR